MVNLQDETQARTLERMQHFADRIMAFYQDLMDRFLQGEDVPADQLRQVSQNTTQPHAIREVPIYKEFFRAVRSVNALTRRGQRRRAGGRDRRRR
jgi:hypothetical protein